MVKWISNNWILVVFLAISTVIAWEWLILNKKRLNVNWWQALLVIFLSNFWGVSMLKLFALLEVGFDVSRAANYRLYGIIFFDTIYIFVQGKIFKQKMSDSFDIYGVALILYIILGRLNCLFQRCCVGYLIGSTGIRWPIREAELLLNAVLLCIFAYKVYKRKTHGEIYPLYMLIYGAFRFAVEFLREEGHTIFGPFHLAHLWSLISVVIGGAILILLRRRQSISADGKKTVKIRK